jgi:hypothetical protein
MIMGWPGYLRAIAAIALLEEEVITLTLGQQPEVLTLPPACKDHPGTKKPFVNVQKDINQISSHPSRSPRSDHKVLKHPKSCIFAAL